MKKLILFDKFKTLSLNISEISDEFEITNLTNLEYLGNHVTSNSCDFLIIGSGYPSHITIRSIYDAKKIIPQVCLAVVIDRESFSKAISYIETGADIILRKNEITKEILRKYNVCKEKQKKIMNCILPASDIEKDISSLSGKNIHVMSRSTRYRYFKENYGKTEKEYIDEKKLENSIKLLLEHQVPVKTISSLVGFENPYYFSRWFKKNTGLTPSKYRDKNSLRGNVVPIGLLVPFNGTYGSCGINLLMGALFALDYRSKPNKYSYKIIPIDTGTNSEFTSRRMKYYIEHEQVNFFTGGISSDVIHTAINIAIQKNILFLNTQGIDDELGKHNNIFRWPLPADEIIRSSLSSSLSNIKTNENVYTLTADYSYGHRLLEKTRQFFDKNDLYLSGNFFHRPGEQNFFPILNKLSELKAGFLIILNYGPDTLKVLNQVHSMRLRDKVTFIAPCTDITQEIIQTGNSFPEGVYLGAQYFLKKKLQENQKFIDAWYKRYHSLPSPVTVGGYIGVKILIDAIEKEETKNIQEIIEIIEHLRWRGLTKNVESMNPENHQSEKSYFLFNSREFATENQCLYSV